VSAKSLGETAFRQMIEKKISTWFSHEACAGVWIMMRFGQRFRGRLAAALPRWSQPLSTMRSALGVPRVRLLAHDLVHQRHERL